MTTATVLSFEPRTLDVAEEDLQLAVLAAATDVGVEGVIAFFRGYKESEEQLSQAA